MTLRPNIIILGASSLIAPWILKRLAQKNYNGQCFSRTQISVEGANNFIWHELDITVPNRFTPLSQSVVISLLPLWLLPPLLPRLEECQQLIAFSTTSIFGKSDSPNLEEQKLIKTIKTAEEEMIKISAEMKIPWTILRPTLIYDGQNDQNITAMARFIQKWRVLPLARPANGLRQPVHADDLAAAAVSTIGNPSAYNRNFNLGGKEILTYQQMSRQVFKALGKPSRILPLPLKLILTTCNLVNLITTKKPNAAMFMRMNQDLIYDYTNAVKALNYSPRPFLPDFQKIEKNSVSIQRRKKMSHFSFFT